ncbi:MAG TPA: plasmid mobilization relaxosome protein MobC [Chitinophagaceae bacterium]|nr:plasmid mobilization relaxosome protein MobC [Chitinophagaceae bacterium]
MMAKEKRNKWKNIRFTENELECLQRKFQHSTSSQLSHYMREILLGRPVVIKYRNESLDNFMEELIAMKKELNAIGHNLNQAVKKLHTLKTIPEFRNWIAKQENMQQEVEQRTIQIEQRISKMWEKWLQG